MTQNALELWPEILAVISGTVVLFLFAITIAISHKSKALPGSSGHRGEEDHEGHEEIQPDGYIDSFAGAIEEAGGGLPPVVVLAVPGILLWWLLYLILNWVP
ncbi:MAG: hypothetical protein ACK2TT_06045 [Anaerolineales bacterium]|jgi:hypothetical protein